MFFFNCSAVARRARLALAAITRSSSVQTRFVPRCSGLGSGKDGRRKTACLPVATAVAVAASVTVTSTVGTCTVGTCTVGMSTVGMSTVGTSTVSTSTVSASSWVAVAGSITSTVVMLTVVSVALTVVTIAVQAIVERSDISVKTETSEISAISTVSATTTLTLRQPKYCIAKHFYYRKVTPNTSRTQIR